MFTVGDRVGDYEIVARLRAGGMATLFLARRRGASGFAKHVAIKVVHPHLAEDPAFVRMFVDEALLSARIDHPNVVHVEELRELDGHHFLVMEYVDGCSLALLLRELSKRERRLNPELAVHVAVRVADGLHAAHELADPQGQPLGVVHRDVSPQNVLLAWKGHVKLIDFGVAKARDRSRHTTSTSLKGKVRYMAPEQAFGKPIDRRADIYALGIVLWEMLTMRRCFRGDNDLALLDQVRNPEIAPPSSLVPGVPPALDRAVMKALAVDPNERFETAQQFRRALVDAMPRAVALDSSDLSELLHAVMAEHIRKSRSVLADGTGEPDAADPEGRGDPEEALRTMTVSEADLASFTDFRSRDRSGVVGGESAPAVAPPGRPRVWPWVAGGVAAVALLVLGGALALGGAGPEEDGPMAVPLEEPPAAVAVAPDAGQLAGEPARAAAVADGSVGDAPVADAPDAADRPAAEDAPAERPRGGRRIVAPWEPVKHPVRRNRPRRGRETRRSPRREGTRVPLADEFGF